MGYNAFNNKVSKITKFSTLCPNYITSDQEGGQRMIFCQFRTLYASTYVLTRFRTIWGMFQIVKLRSFFVKQFKPESVQFYQFYFPSRRPILSENKINNSKPLQLVKFLCRVNVFFFNPVKKTGKIYEVFYKKPKVGRRPQVLKVSSLLRL